MRGNGLRNFLPCFIFVLGLFLCLLVRPAFASTFKFYEDDDSFILANQVGADWADFSGKVIPDKGDFYTGKASLRIAPNQVLVGKGFTVPVRENPKAGEYRYLTMAWKKKGGKCLILQLHWRGKDDKDMHFNYRAGTLVWSPSRELAPTPPSEWTAYEGEAALDLYKDIGAEVDITSVIFSPLDGEYAAFDHIYFTGTVEEAKSLVEPLPGLRNRLSQLKNGLNLAAERLKSFDQKAREVADAQKKISEIQKEIKILVTRFAGPDASLSKTEVESAGVKVLVYEKELKEKIIPLTEKKPWEVE